MSLTYVPRFTEEEIAYAWTEYVHAEFKQGVTGRFDDLVREFLRGRTRAQASRIAYEQLPSSLVEVLIDKGVIDRDNRDLNGAGAKVLDEVPSSADPGVPINCDSYTLEWDLKNENIYAQPVRTRRRHEIRKSQLTGQAMAGG